MCDNASDERAAPARRAGLRAFTVAGVSPPISPPISSRPAFTSTVHGGWRWPVCKIVGDALPSESESDESESEPSPASTAVSALTPDLLAGAETLAHDLRVLRRLLVGTPVAVPASLPGPYSSAPSLTLPQLTALDALCSGPTSVTDLADQLAVTHSTITELVRRLELRGLVQRSRDPKDRRVVRVNLTADGRDLIDAVPPEQRLGALLPTWLDASPGERTLMADGIKTLRQRLQQQAQATRVPASARPKKPANVSAHLSGSSAGSPAGGGATSGETDPPREP